MATDKFITKEQLVEIIQDKGFKNEASTSEEEWGTWIDGKTIYKKAFNVTQSSYTTADGVKTFMLTSFSADKIINVEGNYTLSDGVQYFNIAPGITQDNFTLNSTCRILKTGTGQQFEIQIQTTSTSITSVTLKLNIYYTKV